MTPISLSSVQNGGEGWGEEALPNGRRPAKVEHPSPRSPLTRRWSRTRYSVRWFRHELPQRLQVSALALLVLLPLSGCTPATPAGASGKSAKTPAPDAAPPRTVKTARVQPRPMERTVTVTGSLAAHDQATLRTKVAGRLQSIAVDLGTAVRKGDTLAQIEKHDYELRLQQAEALLAQARARLGIPLEGLDTRLDAEGASTVKQARALLDEAQRNRDRISKLTEQGILARSELELAESGFLVASSKYQEALEEVRGRQAVHAQRLADLAIARQELKETLIVAPFDGTVQERRASPGEFLSVGNPVVTLVRMDPLRLRIEVPERDSFQIRPGQRVRLAIAGDPTPHTGEINRLSPVITDDSRMLSVEADVKNDGTLRPGAFVRAEIVVEDKRPPLVIPRAALVVFAGIEKVFLAQGGKAAERVVATGRQAPDFCEVLSGLKEGDEVILNPGNLQPGQALTITR